MTQWINASGHLFASNTWLLQVVGAIDKVYLPPGQVN
jgi:hypothetical protein